MGRVSDARERLMSAVAELFWTGSYDSTTIDQICVKAGVKKGSFYYFFADKAALAEAALAAEWVKYRPKLDAVYSATAAPLTRISQHGQWMIEEQRELYRRHGCVLGCPLCTLGTEVSTQEQGLRRKVQEIMEYGLRYLESAIRDAHGVGAIAAPDPVEKARLVHAMQLGLLMQARIQNRLAVLDDLIPFTFALLARRLVRNDQRNPRIA
jgi:TetR/AcrR family transcriptional regulator, transcriptional repressor for nem operon